MNIENISALSSMLVRTGFDNGIGYRLLQKICFHPAAFSLVEKIQKGKDLLTCRLQFERRSDEYGCLYYDAALVKTIVMPERVVNGINLAELDLAMGVIEWGRATDNLQFRLDNDQSWEREKNIALVVSELMRLSATEEGKQIADVLKVKYWSDAGLEDLVGNFNAIRSRLEISQRVYFIDRISISVDEVHRFLLNRWMEKKMMAKRRDERSVEERSVYSGGEGNVKEKSLLQKKRVGPKRRQKT